MDARKTAWDRLMTYRFEDADSDRLSIETIDALTYARDTLATQQSRIEALENAVELAKSAWNHQQARIEALEAERDSLKDSMRRAMRKLPHVDRKILAERHGIKEADHE